MKILVLIAGTNDPSNSATLASSFASGINDIGKVHIDIKSLKDMSLEHFNLDCYGDNHEQGEDFRKLKDLFQNADGIVIASPIWNFGVPAHLKNFIDRMGSFALDETRTKGILGGKPFYLIFTGGAPAAAWTGLMKKTTSYVPEAIKYFGGSIIGTYFEGRCTIAKGKFGLVVDKRPESLDHMRKEGFKYSQVVKEFSESGKLPAKQTAIKHLYHLGQSVIKRMK
ncbi:MAG: NAD(P)H-dependent oxidoreductase [Kiritimatiellales bacterium]|nr:NAD(P)H-dependent oxidoreductase [Kiritimatiellales bacterium]